MNLLINNMYDSIKTKNIPKSKKFADITNKVNSKIAKALRNSAPIKPYRKFRAIAICIANILYYYNETKNLKLNLNSVRKAEQLRIYGASMTLLRSWIIEKFSGFFRSIVNSETENINFTKISNDKDHKEEIEKMFTQAKFRVIYFLKQLSKQTVNIPFLAIEFLNDLAHHGSYIDDKCLTNFEKSRLYFDEYKTLYNVDENTKKFIWLYTLICKVIINAVIIDKDVFGAKIVARVSSNLKMIASLIYHCLMDIIIIIIPSKNDDNNMAIKGEEPIGRNLFSKSELEYVYSEQKEFISEITQCLNSWVDTLSEVIKNGYKMHRKKDN